MTERSALLQSEANTRAVYDGRRVQAADAALDSREKVAVSYTPLFTSFSALFSRQLMALAIPPGTGVRTAGA